MRVTNGDDGATSRGVRPLTAARSRPDWSNGR